MSKILKAHPQDLKCLLGVALLRWVQNQAMLSSCLKSWKGLCILVGLLGAASSLLQARQVLPDHTHMPEVTPTTRDRKSLRRAISRPAARYTGPGAQFCVARQSSAASSASFRHRGLTEASCSTQMRPPSAGRAYNSAKIPSRVIKRSSFVALRPAQRTALRTRTSALPATLPNTQPSRSSTACGNTSSHSADSSEIWHSPVSSSATTLRDSRLPVRRRIRVFEI